MMPSPACAGSPNCLFQTPLSPARPRKSGVEMVSRVRRSFFQTRRTPGVRSTRAFCAGVRAAAKPLKADSYTVTVLPTPARRMIAARSARNPSAGGLLPAGRITRQLDDVEGRVRLRPGRDRHREDG